MFKKKQPKDKTDKNLQKGIGKPMHPYPSLGNNEARTSYSKQYSESTNVTIQERTQFSTNIFMSTGNTSYMPTSRHSTNFEHSFPTYKRNSVDVTPFSSEKNNTGYRSPFSRRLTPLSCSIGTVSTGVTPKGVTSSTSVSPFSRQNRLYTSEKIIPRNPFIPSVGSNGNCPNSSIVPEYKTSGFKKGSVLVINNIKFFDKLSPERKGAEHDEKSVINMFKEFGFDVYCGRDLKCKDISERVKKFRSDKSLAKVGVSIVIIMSHGNNANIPGGYTEINGVDGIGINTEDIVNEFTVEKCPALKEKPKIFIFQCCRGEAKEIHVDSTTTVGVKNNADVLIAYSTLPGFSSNRNPQEGSWYIQCICEVFKEHAKKHHVEDMLKIVDTKLSEKHPFYKQTSTYENRGFKKCYLNPN